MVSPSLASPIREQRFVYGGIEFLRLGVDAAVPRDAHRTGRGFASVACAISGSGRSVESHAHRRANKRVHARWDGAYGEISGHGIRARVRALAERRFVATVEYELSDVTAYPVEDVLSQALVEHCGGLVLHAAAIELDGRAVAFIGPSGAGKTTACGLTGAPWFSLDRLVVAPTPAGWWAWPLSGGSTPPRSAPSGQAALPLAAVLRVVRDSETRVTSAGPHQQIFDLRSCCFIGDEDAAPEPGRLEVVANVCNDVPVGRLHTVLGADPSAVIRQWVTP